MTGNEQKERLGISGRARSFLQDNYQIQRNEHVEIHFTITRSLCRAWTNPALGFVAARKAHLAAESQPCWNADSRG
jgi:hypothetical protein